MFLEFGELPARYIIDKNQLNFLYHIYHLKDDDPVKLMWENMKLFPEEKNWWYRVQGLLSKYQLSMDHVDTMSKYSFKKLVKERVKEVAFNDLKKQCEAKQRTGNLSFSSMNPQTYLEELYPNQAKVIIQCRSKTLDIKEFRQYIYHDLICRKCGNADETIEHIVNCGFQEEIDVSVLYSDIMDFPYEQKLVFITIATRINSFFEEIKEKKEVCNPENSS